MRGEVLHFDEAQGFGFITGVDGNRYAFAREDMRQPAAVGKGSEVEFTPSGGQAREVFAIRAQARIAAAPAAALPRSSVPQFGRRGTEPQPQAWTQPAVPVHQATVSTGLWSYFRRGVTANYATFRTRARRKEYWGYYLFWTIAVVMVALLGLVIDAAMGNLDSGMEEPIASFVLPGLYVLATFVPSLAVTIRRIHDLGLSGWFYLLILLPYVGGLILFVFTLIPSQKHENKWGPVPEGVRLPAPYVPSA